MTRVVELIVVETLPEFGRWYAEDAQLQRYLIDADTRLDAPVCLGQKLRPQLTERGYVVSATQGTP